MLKRYGRRIPDLRPGEVVVTLLRSHPLALLSSFAPPLLLLALWACSAFFVVPFLMSLRVDPLLTPNPPPAWAVPVLWVVWLGFAFLLLCRIVYIVFDWRQDWIALTTRRVIVMNKTLFVSEARRECPISKVQNVTAEFPNPVGMAFDFGDIHVDTAGIGTISFKDLPHPKLLREAIFKQQEVTSSRQPPPEDLRKAAVRSIILGKDPAQYTPLPPNVDTRLPGTNRNPQVVSFVSGYRLFNLLFPIAPQRDGARVTWHKHWWFLLCGLALPVLVYMVVLAAWLAVTAMAQHALLLPVAAIVGWLALALFPVCAGWAIWNWEDWRNDLYKLDHERVYHIESLPFGLREQSQETLIGLISDVMYVVPGPVASLLNFGDVVIKTPGEATEFDFKSIRCPREVQQEIMERVDEYRLKGAAEGDKEIEAWLKAYDDVVRGA
jgi:hypothetical protein